MGLCVCGMGLEGFQGSGRGARRETAGGASACGEGKCAGPRRRRAAAGAAEQCGHAGRTSENSTCCRSPGTRRSPEAALPTLPCEPRRAPGWSTLSNRRTVRVMSTSERDAAMTV